MFISEFFKFDANQNDKFNDLGIFDALLDKDSNFFINVIRLKESTVPEFKMAYSNLNIFFGNLATLLNEADSPTLDDVMFRNARKKCKFHEINGINLGFASSAHGAGWGNTLIDSFLSDAYQIVKKGSRQPEIFQLVSLFEEGVGGDRVSDMIASIIEEDIKKYTLRVMSELGIVKNNYPNLTFTSEGLVQNPYKSIPILMLPAEILHELPIARDWYDIDRVVLENETIRREISAEIGKVWTKWQSSEKKRYLKNHVFMNPDVCRRVIDGYKKEKMEVMNLKEDSEYMAHLIFKKMQQSINFKVENQCLTSFEATIAILNIFKDWVENNRGWVEIQDAPEKRREKSVQRYLCLAAKYFVDINNLDISPESDSGRGPVDIKLSRGKDKTLAEIKLSTNNQYIHGYCTQVQEYAKAERTRNLIYVFVDLGNPERLNTLMTMHKKNKKSGIECPELFIIDAREKKSASIF